MYIHLYHFMNFYVKVPNSSISPKIQFCPRRSQVFRRSQRRGTLRRSPVEGTGFPRGKRDGGRRLRGGMGEHQHWFEGDPNAHVFASGTRLEKCEKPRDDWDGMGWMFGFFVWQICWNMMINTPYLSEKNLESSHLVSQADLWNSLVTQQCAKCKVISFNK